MNNFEKDLLNKNFRFDLKELISEDFVYLTNKKTTIWINILIFSYIWPSANYGHQYGGPYSWSKSHTPKAANQKASKAKTSKRHQTTKKSSTYST